MQTGYVSSVTAPLLWYQLWCRLPAKYHETERETGLNSPVDTTAFLDKTNLAINFEEWGHLIRVLLPLSDRPTSSRPYRWVSAGTI